MPINFVFVQIPWSLGILFEKHLTQQMFIKHPLCIKCWQLREVLLQNNNNQTASKQGTWKPHSQAKLRSRPHSSLVLALVYSPSILNHDCLYSQKYSLAKTGPKTLDQWFSKCDPQVSSIKITWERVRNESSQGPSKACWVRSSVMGPNNLRPPGDSMAC